MYTTPGQLNNFGNLESTNINLIYVNKYLIVVFVFVLIVIF